MPRETLDKAFDRLMRAGADPRRADPRYRDPIKLTHRQAFRYSVMAAGMGIGLTLLSLFAAAFWFDLRPAHLNDIRIATLIHAAVPDADSLSQDDLVARVAVPPALGRLLAPLAATDPSRTSLGTTWVDGLWGDPPAITQGRMDALGYIATQLSALPDAGEIDFVNVIIGLFMASREPSNRALIERIGALPAASRRALADSLALRPILLELASLPEDKRQALTNGCLQMLPNDPERLSLMRSIPQLELPEVGLITMLPSLDHNQRQALIYVIEQMRSESPEFRRFLTAYWARDPGLMRALSTVAVPMETRKPLHRDPP